MSLLMGARLTIPANSMKHSEAIAQRLTNSDQWLVEILAETAEISLEDAEKVAAIYKRHKVVKRDALFGRYLFKHGAFIEKETILNSLSLANRNQ